MLKGYRTYITAGIIAAVQIVEAFGLLPPGIGEILTNLSLGAGLGFLRAGVAAPRLRRKKTNVEAS
jgi:hypothetical protein